MTQRARCPRKANQPIPHTAVDEQTVDQYDARTAAVVPIVHCALREFYFGNERGSLSLR